MWGQGGGGRRQFPFFHTRQIRRRDIQWTAEQSQTTNLLLSGARDWRYSKISLLECQMTWMPSEYQMEFPVYQTMMMCRKCYGGQSRVATDYRLV
ncbi:hypothetical protein Pelo_815 [Pelomyxa schiedti]|nr:hypothetical protein Pelo_815 [Pelomyxa schiedti]